VVTFDTGSHWNDAGNPVEYLDVMYQNARPVRSRSVNVLAIMKFPG